MSELRKISQERGALCLKICTKLSAAQADVFHGASVVEASGECVALLSRVAELVVRLYPHLSTFCGLKA